MKIKIKNYFGGGRGGSNRILFAITGGIAN